MFGSCSRGGEHEEPAVIPVTPRQRRLGALLEEDIFLERILMFLVDDGLHECRRVCRRWNDVCKRLPVKLSGIHVDHLARAATMFPNAVSADVRVWTRRIEHTHYSCRTASCSLLDLELVRAQMTRLKEIQIETTKIGSTISYGDAKIPCFDRVEDAAVKRCHRRVSAHLMPSLSGLTNLTCLTLSVAAGPSKLVTLFTELQFIQDLEINSLHLLINNNQELTFPSLVQLTRLSCRIHVEEVMQKNDRNKLEVRLLFDCPHLKCAMKVLLQYKDTLRSLKLDVYGANDRLTDWSFLEGLASLESLWMSSTRRHSQCIVYPVFWMQNLTELYIKSMRLDTATLKQLAFSLVGLEKLMVQNCSSDQPTLSAAFQFDRLARMTSLSFDHTVVWTSVSSLTGLKELRIRNSSGPVPDLLSNLKQLSNLESLCLLSIRNSIGACEELLHLKQLKSLTVSAELDPKKGVIPTLALLPELTRLVFVDNPFVPHPTADLKQFNLLSNLRALDVCALGDHNPCVYMETGSLPRLREIRLCYSCLSESVEADMYRRCPSLRSLTVLRNDDWPRLLSSHW